MFQTPSVLHVHNVVTINYTFLCIAAKLKEYKLPKNSIASLKLDKLILLFILLQCY